MASPSRATARPDRWSQSSLSRERDHGENPTCRPGCTWRRRAAGMVRSPTWVERNYGYGIARTYAGHTDANGGSTLTYIKGVPREVATALSTLTGEDHPLALTS